MWRRCFGLKILLCLILITLITGCNRTDADPMVTTSTSNVGTSGLTYTVERGTITRELEFTGRISPVEETPLYFKTIGYVKQVLVQPGDQVQVGDLLAELEVELGIDSLQNQITTAELNLAVAQSSLTQAEEANTYAIAQAEMTLEVAQEQLARIKALQATYDAATTSARVGLERAKDLVTRAEIEYQNAQEQVWEPEEVRETAALALRQARWELEIAQALYDQAIADETIYQHDVNVAEIAVRQAKADLEQVKKGIDPVLALQVQQAQQVLDSLREGPQIISPVDGEVISLALYPGHPVEPFQPVIIIAEPSAIEVSVGLSDEQLQEMSEGQTATVFLSVDPEHSWIGTVSRLPYPYGTGGSSENLAGGDNSTRISLEGDVSELKLGDLVHVTIVLEEKHDVLWLPPDAIRSFQERQFVIAQDGNSQHRIDVELGIETQDRVEILGGLEEGQVIVVP
jgi:multidrug efflux pump subunit AcrA (membrane-fusion protein)